MMTGHTTCEQWQGNCRLELSGEVRMVRNAQCCVTREERKRERKRKKERERKRERKRKKERERKRERKRKKEEPVLIFKSFFCEKQTRRKRQ